MTDTTKLGDMLDGLIKQKSEQAEVDFHTYLQDKMREIVYKETNKDDPKD